MSLASKIVAQPKTPGNFKLKQLTENTPSCAQRNSCLYGLDWV